MSLDRMNSFRAFVSLVTCLLNQLAYCLRLRSILVHDNIKLASPSANIDHLVLPERLSRFKSPKNQFSIVRSSD